MIVNICAVGALKNSEWASIFKDYHDRALKLSKNIGISCLDVHEVNYPRGKSADRLSDERLAQKIQSFDGVFFLLDEKGKAYSSTSFAQEITKLVSNNVKSLSFGIGGPAGHGPKTRALTHRSIAFGDMTWPHMLVRVMLMEQLYRTMTILNAVPYHK